MKENAIKKINKFGKVGVIVGQILKVFCVLSAVVMIVYAIVMMMMPKDLLEVSYYNGVRCKLDVRTLPVEERDAAVAELLGSVDGEPAVMVTTVGNNVTQLKVVGTQQDLNMVSVDYNEDNQILSMDMQSEGSNVFAKGKTVIMVLATILLAASEFVTFAFVVKLCRNLKNCDTPFIPEVLKDIKKTAFSLIPWCITWPLMEAAMGFMVSNAFTFTINIGMILIVFVVLALSHVFSYGAMLQQESDETL